MPTTKERANDPVRAYMKQMGQTELLTKEQEVEIFKRIEKAQKKAFNLLSVSKMTYNRFCKLGKDLLKGSVRFEDFIDCDSTKEKFLKGLPKLVKALENTSYKDAKCKTLYKRMHVKQAIIGKW